jgi:hypothetical protein
VRVALFFFFQPIVDDSELFNSDGLKQLVINIVRKKNVGENTNEQEQAKYMRKRNETEETRI